MPLSLWCVAEKQPNGRYQLVIDSVAMVGSLSIILWSEKRCKDAGYSKRWGYLEKKGDVKLVRLVEEEDED